MMRKSISVTAVLVAGTVGLGACSGQNATPAPPAPFPSSGPMQRDMPQLPELTGQQGARRDLTKDQCQAKDGKWSASGTVTNSADKAMVYIVSFSVATQEGGMVRGRAVETLTLKAGESEELTKKDFFSSSEQGLHCVTMVLRGNKVVSSSAATPSSPASSNG